MVTGLRDWYWSAKEEGVRPKGRERIREQRESRDSVLTREKRRDIRGFDRGKILVKKGEAGSRRRRGRERREREGKIWGRSLLFFFEGELLFWGLGRQRFGKKGGRREREREREVYWGSKKSQTKDGKVKEGFGFFIVVWREWKRIAKRRGNGEPRFCEEEEQWSIKSRLRKSWTSKLSCDRK